MNWEETARDVIADFGAQKGLDALGFANGRAVVASGEMEIGLIHPDPSSDCMMIAIRTVKLDASFQALDLVFEQAAELFLKDNVVASLTEDSYLQISSMFPLVELTGQSLSERFDDMCAKASALVTALEAGEGRGADDRTDAHPPVGTEV